MSVCNFIDQHIDKQFKSQLKVFLEGLDLGKTHRIVVKALEIEKPWMLKSCVDVEKLWMLTRCVDVETMDVEKPWILESA